MSISLKGGDVSQICPTTDFNTRSVPGDYRKESKLSEGGIDHVEVPRPLGS